MNEKYYLVVVQCGHVGYRNSFEVTRYFKDFDILNAYISAREMPRSKKKNSSVKTIKQITYEEYIVGKELEKDNVYLNTYAC